MKQYCCKVRTTDGDHEYNYFFEAFGKDYMNCLRQAESLVASGFFDFEDGQTVSELGNMQEMTKAEERVLRKFKVI